MYLVNCIYYRHPGYFIITTCLTFYSYDTPLIPTVIGTQQVIWAQIRPRTPYIVLPWALHLPKKYWVPHLFSIIHQLNRNHAGGDGDAPFHGELKCTMNAPHSAIVWVLNVPMVMGPPMQDSRRSALLPCGLA